MVTLSFLMMSLQSEPLKKKGVPREEAADYAIVGCVEPTIPGREYGWHDAAYINTAKFMEMVLNGGRCLDCGEHCGKYGTDAAH